MICPRPSNDWLSERRDIRDLAFCKPTALPVILVNPPKTQAVTAQRRTLKAPISTELARARGYGALTTLYTSSERWMLENVVADMERGGPADGSTIDYQLVGFVDQFGNHIVEVWRKGLSVSRTTLWMRSRAAAQLEDDAP